MRMFATILIFVALPGRLFAGAYVQQSSFTLPMTSMKAMDSDAVGNLYVLGLPPGATTYAVASYSTQGISPLFSFDTGIATPVAFAVEDSGIVDVLDGSGGLAAIVLKRFQNNGVFLGQTVYSLTSPYYIFNWVSSAIDKATRRVYLTYQVTHTMFYPMCLGCGGPPTRTNGIINQFDFSGNQLLSVTMPGDNNTSGTCYTPSLMTADSQGNLYVADAACQHVLKYSAAGSLLSDTPASNWTYNFAPRGLWTDPLSNLYISEPVCSPAGCPYGVVKVGPDGSFQTSLVADSAMGCAWDQRILYLSSSGSQPLRRFLFNGTPSVPAQSGPLGTVVQHSSAAALSWQSSNDPDSDPVTYSVLMGTVPTQLTSIGNPAQNSLTSQPLVFGVTYYWQVVASDSYQGLAAQASPSPVMSFNLNLVNSPPGNFSVAGGTGSVVTRAASINLSWQAASDPDSDPLVYDVLWRPSSQSTQTVAATTDQTSWQMPGLAFGATYYWSVRARDAYGASRLMSGGAEQLCHPVFKNSLPAMPAVLWGAGLNAQHTLTPQANLAWSPVDDPDGDAVAYRLFVGTDPAALALVQDGTSSSYNFTAPMTGTTYYWQASAYDPYGGASTIPVQSLYLSLRNSPPSPFAVTAGTGTVATRGSSLPLSWQVASDPDGDQVSYDLAVSTTLGVMPIVQSSTATNFSLPVQFGTTYYWQVTARDGFGGATASGLQTLFPVFRNSPPTVPTNQSPTGTMPYHGLAPSQSFFWQAATDPDGDPVSYQLYLGTAAASLALVPSASLGYTASNLAINTAYYYKVVAVDSYGAASNSPVNWVYYQFTDAPPQPFSAVSGFGTANTRSTANSLAWTAAADPDGDPVGYRVYFGTGTAALPLAADTRQTSTSVGPLELGTTYYWRVEAYDSFGATTALTGGVQSLIHLFKNSPPAPIVYLSTAGVLNLHAASAAMTLNWAASADPDGDPVSYELDMSTGAGYTAVSLGSSTAMTTALQFDKAYQWRAIAADPYGGLSIGAWMPLIAHMANQAPNAIQYLAPASLRTRTTSYLLTWGDTGDPDGDPVSYRFELGGSSNALAAVQFGSMTAYALLLQSGTTAYYRVTAVDSFGTSTAGQVQAFFPTFLNDPPQSPNVVAPFKNAPVVKTMKNSVTVSWEQVTNPQGDPITYTVYFGDSAGNMSPLATIVQAGLASLALRPLQIRPQAEVQTAGNTVTLSLTGLDFYKGYYLRVEASNPYGASATTGIQHFSLASADGFPTAYNYPNPFNPSRGGTNIVFNAPPSGYGQATVEVYSEWQDLLFKQDYFNIPPGISQVHFDGRDRSGKAFFNGSYVCRVRFSNPDNKQTFYMAVVK